MEVRIEPPENIKNLENILLGLYFIRRRLLKDSVGLRLLHKKKEKLYRIPALSVIYDSVSGSIENIRKEVEGVIEAYAKQHPMWDAFFARIKGIGPLYAGIILGRVPAWKFPNPSALRKYTGWAPPHVYGGKRRYDGHLKAIFYIVATNFLKVKNKYSSEYYAWRKKEDLKLKLMEKYADKVSGKIKEDDIDEELAVELGIKSLEELHKIKPPANKLHAHYRAIRKMISMFLAHYFEMYWRVVLKVKNPPKPYFVIKGMGEYFPPEAFFDL